MQQQGEGVQVATHQELGAEHRHLRETGVDRVTLGPGGRHAHVDADDAWTQINIFSLDSPSQLLPGLNVSKLKTEKKAAGTDNLVQRLSRNC